ncbi:MAG: cytidine deaminase [Clostridia bacterium]
MDYKELMKSAITAREFAYAPYSKFKVGAALLCSDGKVYTGCNIECATFSPTNCAERTALFKAVSEGEREFVAIAVAGANESSQLEFCTPCGVCRQMLAEFVNVKTFDIIMFGKNELKVMKLDELLPYSFGSKDLQNRTN